MASTVSTLRSTANEPSRHSTTFGQYLQAVEVEMRERRGMRKGQTFFNVLLELQPQLAHCLEHTADDPFYNDRKLPEFLLRVGEALQ